MKVRSFFLAFGFLLAWRPSGAAERRAFSLQWHAPEPETSPTGSEVHAEVLQLAGTGLRVTQPLACRRALQKVCTLPFNAYS
jgi:hypothetical protein